MPIALDNPSRNSIGRGVPSGRPVRPRQSAPQAHEAAQVLTKLLASAPIDLSGISDEIRRHPDLESLILRPAASLVPSLDEPLSTIEEAVVVLGANRLRTLIDLWSSTSSVDVGLLQIQQNSPSS